MPARDEAPPTFTKAVVVGAGGAIGHALLDLILTRRMASSAIAWCRSPPDIALSSDWSDVDVLDEASITRAAAKLGAVDLVVVASGVLHNRGRPVDSAAIEPEKSWRSIDPDMMGRVLAVNTIGPVLVAKHLLPLFPRDRRTVFAALSARVGSISDNRLGGWYSYRASKAALNQIIRTLSIELARTHPQAICVGLHPGTVDTPLSRPFQAGVAQAKLVTPGAAASRLLDVIEQLTPHQTGRVLDAAGNVVPE